MQSLAHLANFGCFEMLSPYLAGESMKIETTQPSTVKRATTRRFLVFCILLFVLSGCVVNEDNKMNGEKAPEIEGLGVKGEPIKLSDYKGKVVLLDFWGTWCGPCRGEIPKERELVQHYNGRPFAILGIDGGDSREKLSEFLVDNPLPWSNIIDGDERIFAQWRVKSVPTFVLIDHNGYVRGRWSGGGQSNRIDAAVEKALKDAEKKQ
jgi:thiol-disulfide isomerase/thioredoxin